MKIFEKGEFACEKHISEGGVDGNGQQHISICLKCRLDDRGICNGEQLVCENDHKRNSYRIFLMNDTRYIKYITKGKGETLSLCEVLKIAETI